jgi:cell division protein WhiA
MLVASEIKGELARIVPARACCRLAELAGLLSADRRSHGVRTFDHGTARIAVQLAATLGVTASAPHGDPPAAGRRHHLEVGIDRAVIADWQWETAAACDHRAYLRGALLGNGSISLAARGPHVEFVFHSHARARRLVRHLAQSSVRSSIMQRRGRWVVYVKAGEDIATLLRLTGANRGLLDFETSRVGREVRNRLNRLMNADEANLARTVAAADRQLHAIRLLNDSGRLNQLPIALREAAAQRRAQPEADLDAIASALGVSRSAANHRLRRLVELALERDEPVAEGASR